MGIIENINEIIDRYEEETAPLNGVERTEAEEILRNTIENYCAEREMDPDEILDPEDIEEILIDFKHEFMRK